MYFICTLILDLLRFYGFLGWEKRAKLRKRLKEIIFRCVYKIQQKVKQLLELIPIDIARSLEITIKLL